MEGNSSGNSDKGIGSSNASNSNKSGNPSESIYFEELDKMKDSSKNRKKKLAGCLHNILIQVFVILLFLNSYLL